MLITEKVFSKSVVSHLYNSFAGSSVKNIEAFQVLQSVFCKVQESCKKITLYNSNIGVDPGFFLGAGSLLRNGITDWRDQLILKVNRKQKASTREGCTPPYTFSLDPPLDCKLLAGFQKK